MKRIAVRESPGATILATGENAPILVAFLVRVALGLGLKWPTTGTWPSHKFKRTIRHANRRRL